MKQALAVAISAVFCFTAAVYPQSKDGDPRLTFEVASVKLNTTGSSNMSINYAPGGALSAVSVSPRMLIAFAYNLQDYQILSAPEWAATDRYDVSAKPEASQAAQEGSSKSDGTQSPLRVRTRALLADRFGLATHAETKEMPVYELVVAKGGPKLTQSTAEIPQISSNNRRVICKKVTLKRFAEVLLASRMGRTVVDKTGLTGEYDLQMEFAPDPGPAKPGAEPAPPSDPAGPTFLDAMREQLGLRLQAGKGMGEFLVIEQMHRPTAN